MAETKEQFIKQVKTKTSPILHMEYGDNLFFSVLLRKRRFLIMVKLTINIFTLHIKVSNFKKFEENLEKKSNLDFF